MDHRGVPNCILATEDERLASIYNNKAIAEQNSVNLAWDILMAPEFEKGAVMVNVVVAVVVVACVGAGVAVMSGVRSDTRPYRSFGSI